MTLSFNLDSHQSLLAYYKTHPIGTEEDNEKALAIVETLMHHSNRTSEEDELYNLLVTLIERFEQDYYLPEASCTPHSLLNFLLNQRCLQPMDLRGILGTEATICQVLNGQRKISPQQAQALGDFFKVSPEVLT